MSVGYAELALNYGGTFGVTEQFDLAIVVDTRDDPAATSQWVELMLGTNPRQYDTNGNPAQCGDDLCNQSFGGGCRAMVGQLLTNELINERAATILKLCNENPQISATPTPSVSVAEIEPGLAQVLVECYTISGARVSVNKTYSVFGG